MKNNELDIKQWLFIDYDNVSDKIIFAIIPHVLDMPTGFCNTRSEAINDLKRIARQFLDDVNALDTDHCEYTEWRTKHPTAKNSEYLESLGFSDLNFSNIIE